MSALVRLMGSRFFSSLGYQVMIISGVYEMFRSTGSALMTGTLGAALFVPSLIFNFMAGCWADRTPRKQVAYFALQAAFAILPFLLILGEGRSKWLILAVFAGSAVLRTLRTPFFYALSHSHVIRSTSAASITRFACLSWQIPLVLGPILFSLLAGLGSSSVALFFSAGLLTLAALLSLPIRSEDDSRKPQAQNPRDLKTTSRSNAHEWVKASLLDAGMMTFLSYLSLLPFLLNHLGEDPTRLGTLRAVMSLGSLVCIWFFDRGFLRNNRRLSFVTSMFLAAALVFFLPSAAGWISLAAFSFGFGVLDGVSILYRDFLLFSSPAETIGRSSALSQVFNSASDDLGEFRAGLAGETFGTDLGIRISALVGVAISLALIIAQSSSTPVAAEHKNRQSL